MNRYELVILVDTRLSQDKMSEVISSVENLFKDNIKQKDDIGMLDLAYTIEGNARAFFVSYDVELDPSKISEYKRTLSLQKGLLRYAFYKIANNDKFLSFAEVNKMFEVSEEEKLKQQNEKAFKDMDSGSKRKNNK